MKYKKTIVCGKFKILKLKEGYFENNVLHLAPKVILKPFSRRPFKLTISTQRKNVKLLKKNKEN